MTTHEYTYTHFFKQQYWVGAMGSNLRAPAALAEDQSGVPDTYKEAHNSLELQS